MKLAKKSTLLHVVRFSLTKSSNPYLKTETRKICIILKYKFSLLVFIYSFVMQASRIKPYITKNFHDFTIFLIIIVERT